MFSYTFLINFTLSTLFINILVYPIYTNDDVIKPAAI